jgi:hydroxymethylpyrimidine pyrophosphatase-like HAD family hydrolase
VLFSRPLPKHVVNAVIEFAERSKTLLQLYPADHQLYLSCANDEHRAHAERYRQLTGCTLVHVESYARFRDTQPFKMLLLTWPKPHEVEALREALTRAVPEIRTEAHIVSGQFVRRRERRASRGARACALARSRAGPGRGLTPARAQFVEVLHPRANKEMALRELCKQLDIGMEHVVAFGDGDNDKEMLGSVGLGVAVKNAVPQAKRRAAHVSPLTNDEDAVARELEHLLEAGAFQPLARAQQETRRRRVASRL